MQNYDKYLPPHMQVMPAVNQRCQIYPIWVPKWDSPLKNDPRRVHKIEVNLHAYTHIESSAHLVKDGKFLHEYPLDTFVAKACVMDFSHKEAKSTITKEELMKQWVDGCEAFIVRTDWQKKRGLKGVMGAKKADMEESPKFTPEAVQWIIAKKPKLYMDDFDVTPQPPGKKIMFEAGICHVMNATNIDQIRKKVVTLIALPLKIYRTSAGTEGVEATPTRAIALEED